MSFIETDKKCPLCNGDLEYDRNYIAWRKAARFPANLNPLVSLRDFATLLIGHDYKRREPINSWFKCLSCSKRSVVCPECDRSFLLSSRKQRAEIICTHCGKELIVVL